MKKTKFSYEAPELETFSFSKLSIVRGESCVPGVTDDAITCDEGDEGVD